MTNKMLVYLYEKQNGRCAYTGDRMTLDPSKTNHRNAATRDHVIPRSRGGVTREYNLVACTRAANCIKGDRRLLDYLIEITNGHPERHPMYNHPAIRNDRIILPQMELSLS